MLQVDAKKKMVILQYMPNSAMLEKLANYFQGYSDKTRVSILSALSMSELCVTDLSDMLKINQTTISHQLKFLKSLQIVKYKRDGKLILYSLSSNIINEIMLNGVEHIQRCNNVGD